MWRGCAILEAALLDCKSATYVHLCFPVQLTGVSVKFNVQVDE